MRKGLFILALFFLNCAIVSSQGFPPLPTGYWGYLTQDGDGVQGEDVIVKDVSGIVVAVANSETDQDGLYSLDVLWDNTNTDTDEGVENSETIFFYVGSELVEETTVGAQGSNIRLDLVTESTDANQDDSEDGSGSSGSDDSGTDSQDTVDTSAVNVDDSNQTDIEDEDKTVEQDGDLPVDDDYDTEIISGEDDVGQEQNTVSQEDNTPVANQQAGEEEADGSGSQDESESSGGNSTILIISIISIIIVALVVAVIIFLRVKGEKT